jgi:DNA mismatch endonuclease (patch repair protein)
MRSVRQKGTSPELAVRAALNSLGVVFETNVEDLPGKPDIMVTQTNTPIFVHGCFWHRHPDCRMSTTPKRNRKFWIKKFKQNIERDNRILYNLRALGHTPVIVWQCETIEESTLKEILLNRVWEITS